MHLIKNNPYRTIGILVGATAAEQRRQLIRLQRFIEAEQEPDNDFSFPTLGKLHRTVESISDAASKLNLDKDKMSAALFWFYKGNQITDEPALDSLKEADQQNATEIWTKLTATGEVHQRNGSAFQNLSTLLLCNAVNGSSINKELLEQGISLKLKFLESDFINDFKALATDETYKTTKKKLQLLFLNQFQYEIDQNSGITINKFLEIINKQDFSAKEDFIKGFIQKPIEQIENKIEIAKTKQNANKAIAGTIGFELDISTKKELALLKSILGNYDQEFISISDKLANEILQCSINLFNHFYNTETEVGEIALELNKTAKSIALGSVVNERIDESRPVFEKYIQAQPVRENQNIVEDDLKIITDKLEKFQTQEDSISNALWFANFCKPYLDNIKLTLGINDDLYTKISTSVASNAQGMIVSTVNAALDKRTRYLDYYRDISHKIPSAPEYSFEELKNEIQEAWKATIILVSFDMSDEQRDHFNKNKDSLKKLYKNADSNIVFYEDTPIQKWMLWAGGILVLLLLVYAIWGTDGISAIFGIAFFIAILAGIGYLRNLKL